MPNEYYQATKNVRKAEGDLMYSIDCFGDHLAKREGYKSLNGIEAIHYYLVQKHNWLPAQVRSLNVEDIHFLLKEEMNGWVLPQEAL